MAQYRKTIFNLSSGPGEAIPDPRVAEAQSWLQLGDGMRAQAYARDAQIATAQAAQRRAAIEASAKNRELDVRKQIAAIEADARLQEALMREEGWSGREEMRGQREDKRQRSAQAAEWQKALMQAGLEDDREDRRDARLFEREDRIDERERAREERLGRPKWSDREAEYGFTQKQLDMLPEDPEEALAYLRMMDPGNPAYDSLQREVARRWQAAPPTGGGVGWTILGQGARQLARNGGLGAVERAVDYAAEKAAFPIDMFRSGVQMLRGENLPLPPELGGGDPWEQMALEEMMRGQ